MDPKNAMIGRGSGDPATLLREHTPLDSMTFTHAFLLDTMIQERLHLDMDNNQLTQTRDLSNSKCIPQTMAVHHVFSKQFFDHYLGIL
jgi:hypothetical protein